MKGLFLLIAAVSYSQTQPTFTGQAKVIYDQLRTLRSQPDDQWTKSVATLAAAIQRLPESPERGILIGRLGNLVTEGDAGHDTLQLVASTLAETLKDSSDPSRAATLAQLVYYEHLTVKVENEAYRLTLAKLETENQRRVSPDFSLTDLKGVTWSLKDLQGKVVLVNFWATWCPPCRKEMPDMESLYQRFASRGLVILAISDEDLAKVQPFIAEHTYTYPVLLDPGKKVHELFGVEGIPKSFLYGRNGKLAAQAIDRRTQAQFLKMLKLAGLE